MRVPGLIAAVTISASTVVAASPVAAQRDYGRPLDTPANRAAGMLRYSGYCAVRDVPASARKVLETSIGSDDEAKRVKTLTALARKCYRPELPPFPPTAVRNSIAEALYLNAYRTTPPPAIEAGPPPASFGVVPEEQKGSEMQEAAWSLAAIARCAVFADPANARELVLGPANVDEETKRFVRLQPALAKCVGAEQAALLTPQTTRGFIADALWRTTPAARSR